MAKSITKTSATTIDGKTVTLTSAQQLAIGNRKICTGGGAEGCMHIGPHAARWEGTAIWWDDNLVKHEIRLNLDRARANYFCRHCRQYLGCKSCIATVLLTEIFCLKCQEYANEYGFLHHGDRHQPIVEPEKEIGGRP